MTKRAPPISLVILTMAAIVLVAPWEALLRVEPPMPTAVEATCGADASPSTESYRVAVLVGSLREDSYSRMLAEELKIIAPKTMDLEIVEVGDLPYYNPDLDEEGEPKSWRRFRRQIEASDAVLFVTPEYNRSVPAVLKNAVDVGSRPFREGAMAQKPGAIISLTTGRLGGFGANHHLRQALVVVDVPVMHQPEAYVSRAGGLFDDDGRLVDEDTRSFMKGFLVSFEGWVDKNSPEAIDGLDQRVRRP